MPWTGARGIIAHAGTGKAVMNGKHSRVGEGGGVMAVLVVVVVVVTSAATIRFDWLIELTD